MSRRLCFLHSAAIFSMSAGMPKVCCTITALDRIVIFFCKSCTSILKSSLLQSTYTGFNLAHNTGFGTALQVNACKSTSSPSLRSKAFKIARRDDLPLLNANACFTPSRSANTCSNFCLSVPFFQRQGCTSSLKASDMSSCSVFGEREIEIGFIRSEEHTSELQSQS